MSRSSDIKEISNPQEFKEFYLNDAYAVILKKFLIFPLWIIGCWGDGSRASEKAFSFIKVFFIQSWLRMKN